jgi:hypothetical protein
VRSFLASRQQKGSAMDNLVHRQTVPLVMQGECRQVLESLVLPRQALPARLGDFLYPARDGEREEHNGT